MRQLDNAAVTVSAGTLIAFHDTDGGIRALVAEAAHPAPARPIAPLVTFRLPGLDAADVACDHPFTIVSRTPSRLSLRLSLQPDAVALLSVQPGR